jgi:hypothetical protein
VLGGVRIERLPVDVLAPDLHEVVADRAGPLHAVSDEHHLLAVAELEGAVVLAEHEVDLRELFVALLVVEAQDLDDLLHHARAAAPAVVLGRVRGRLARVGLDARALEVLVDLHEADLKAGGARPCLLERDVAVETDLLERHGTEAAFVGEADVLDAQRIEPDDHAADRVDGDLVVADDEQLHVPRDRREHSPLAGDDRVDDDELRLDHVLEVGHLPVQRMVVVDEAMTVVLDPDVVLHREGHGRPRVRLELRAVDEEVCLGHGLGREDVVAEASLVRERDLHLRHLFEAVALRAGALEDRLVARLFVRVARRNRDGAPLADRELAHR